MKVTVGIGYDAHQLKEGESLILGGCDIPSPKGSLGHSDGDVLIHAVVDAILGASGLGDIGQYFPSDDDQWKGKDSQYFLNYSNGLIKKNGFKIVHIDTVIILQQPRLSNYIPLMEQAIAGTLDIDPKSISVKATTTDHLGYIGRGEGIAAQAIVTLNKEG